METMKIKDLKKLLYDLEQQRGNINELKIWILPIGTPPLEVYSMGMATVQDDNTKYNVPIEKEVFCVHLEGDCF